MEDIEIYMDIPAYEDIFTDSRTKNIFSPIRETYGTYWSGIFAGSPEISTLFCPSFYLAPDEINTHGDMAYITRSYMTYNDEQRVFYSAVYFSKELFNDLLTDNLSSEGNVAYLINSRDNIIAASSFSLTGAYPFSHTTITNSLMSSNNFIQKRILGEDVYAGFYTIPNTDWYMVVVMPSRPMLQKSLYITLAFAFLYFICIIFAFSIANYLSRTTSDRLSAVINQMAQCRTSPPVPLPDSQYTDEIGHTII